jgi:aquaporin Z
MLAGAAAGAHPHRRQDACMSKDTPDLSLTTGSVPAGGPDAISTSGTGAHPVVRAGAQLPEPPAAAHEDEVDDLDDLGPETGSPSLLLRVGAEGLGTFFLVLVGLGISLYSALSGATSLGVALGFGLALVGGTIAFGHVSGGHFNPAVTIGSAVAGRTPWTDVLPYWLAQLVGGALASAVLFLTIPSALPRLVAQGKAATTRSFFSGTASGWGGNSPLAKLSQGQAAFAVLPVLLIEIVATALLVAVFLAATNRRTQRLLAPFAIGLTYAVLVLLAAPIGNGSVNPARATAAALFSNGLALRQLWLFWLAPVVGAALAGLAYRAFGADPGQELLSEDDELAVDDEEIVVESVRR